MPWHAERSDECPASRPWAVILDADGSVVACHATEASARRQIAALYANAKENEMDDIGRKIAPALEVKLSQDGEVSVAFSRLDVVDLDGDITRHGAFPVGKHVPMSDFGHTSWEGAKPVGRGVISEQDDLGIFTGRFFTSTTHGRDAYETVKEMGELQEWSYGFTVIDSGSVLFDGKTHRELRKLDVLEVSPVLKGAGLATSTLAIKSGAPGAELPYAEHLSWVQEQVKALVDRTSDRSEWRAKEGRTLSQANRARLSAILEAMDAFGSVAEELRRLIEDADPTGSEAAKRAHTTLMVEIERARALGVPF